MQSNVSLFFSFGNFDHFVPLLLSTFSVLPDAKGYHLHVQEADGFIITGSSNSLGNF